MKKLILLSIICLTVSSISAQSFLKKIGNATKTVTQTEQTNVGNESPKAEGEKESAGPISINLESTRIIGDKLLITCKIESSEDIRLMNIMQTNAITPDGEIYELKDALWGGRIVSLSSFDQNLVADIKYTCDLIFNIKSKKIEEVASLTVNIFNHTAQKYLKIPIKEIKVPFPADPNLANPSVIEISKNAYLTWIKVEETKTDFKISFVLNNKGTKDQVIRFNTYNMKVVDNEGNSYDAEISLKDNITLSVDTPVAGNIYVKKPLKLNKISLIEFSSDQFNYKIKKIILPDTK